MHEVELDKTSSGYIRYSCKSCAGRAVVRQPFMNNAEWLMAKESFFTEHPNFIKGKVSGTCVFCGNVRNDLPSKEVKWYCTYCFRFQDSINDYAEQKLTG